MGVGSRVFTGQSTVNLRTTTSIYSQPSTSESNSSMWRGAKLKPSMQGRLVNVGDNASSVCSSSVGDVYKLERVEEELQVMANEQHGRFGPYSLNDIITLQRLFEYLDTDSTDRLTRKNLIDIAEIHSSVRGALERTRKQKTAEVPIGRGDLTSASRTVMSSGASSSLSARNRSQSQDTSTTRLTSASKRRGGRGRSRGQSSGGGSVDAMEYTRRMERTKRLRGAVEVFPGLHLLHVDAALLKELDAFVNTPHFHGLQSGRAWSHHRMVVGQKKDPSIIMDEEIEQFLHRLATELLVEDRVGRVSGLCEMHGEVDGCVKGKREEEENRRATLEHLIQVLVL